MRSAVLRVRRLARWSIAGLGVSLIGLGAGLWVGATRAPTHPAPDDPTARGQPIGDIGLPSSYQTPSPTPLTWNPLPEARQAFRPVALVVERIGVQARVEDKGIDSHNVMEAPDRPLDVAWYPFTAEPGSGGNAVFAGHRDYWGVGPAVFWRLGDLRAGDLIDVVSAQRTEVRYRVASTVSYNLTSIPMASVLAPSGQDQVTLLTCDGTFHQTGGYDHRLVVKAVRVA